MGRSPCCGKGVKRGAWSMQEDQTLINYIKTHGQGKWRSVAQKAGLKRCGKSCRLRWLNYLRPDIKRGAISADEEDLIIRLHSLLGNRWALIAKRLPGRTDNEIKNYWNTNLAKKFDDGPKTSKKLPIKSSTSEPDEKKPETSLIPPQEVHRPRGLGFHFDHELPTDQKENLVLLDDDDSFNLLMEIGVSDIFIPEALDFSHYHDQGDQTNVIDSSTNHVTGCDHNCNILSASKDEIVRKEDEMMKSGIVSSELSLDVELKRVASFLELEDEQWE